MCDRTGLPPCNGQERAWGHPPPQKQPRQRLPAVKLQLQQRLGPLRAAVQAPHGWAEMAGGELRAATIAAPQTAPPPALPPPSQGWVAGARTRGDGFPGNARRQRPLSSPRLTGPRFAGGPLGRLRRASFGARRSRPKRTLANGQVSAEAPPDIKNLERWRACLIKPRTLLITRRVPGSRTHTTHLFPGNNSAARVKFY